MNDIRTPEKARVRLYDHIPYNRIEMRVTWNDGVETYAIDFRDAKVVKIDTHPLKGPYHESYPEPVSLPRDLWQGVMNDLWHMGFRPSNVVASEGLKEAMASHIGDLRKITDQVIGLNRTLIEKDATPK